MSHDSTIDDTYEVFGESLSIAREYLKAGESSEDIINTMHQLAINAFFMLFAETLKHIKNGDDAWAIHATVSRAMRLVVGAELCAKLRRDRLLAMFPSLHEGDAA